MKKRIVLFSVLMICLFLIPLSSASGIGGNITYSGAFTIHTFTTNGSFVWVGDPQNITVLVVSGGGAGGSYNRGGGGGAGGLYYNASFVVNAWNYSVVVGAGGIGAKDGLAGLNGSNSSFGNITMKGGGGGGANAVEASSFYGRDGGSGGGGSGEGNGGNASPAGYGNKGGNGLLIAPNTAGGGGGAGSAGVAALGTVNGNGGYGLNYSINGSVVCYAGGGGAGATSGQTIGSAIVGCGGGNGGLGGAAFNGLNASANSGGGGGGAGTTGTGGNGGSGIVIIQYEASNFSVSLSFINPTPSDAAHNNTQVNISLNCSSSPARYNLYFDSTFPPTTKVIDNSSTSYFLTNVSTNGAYYYFANCVVNTTSSVNSSVRSWFYDTGIPSIEAINNRSVYNSSYNLKFNFSDNIGVYAYEILINKQSSGVLYLNDSNSSTGSPLSFIYERQLNISNWSTGVYIVNATITDPHTDAFIQDYAISKVSDLKGEALVFNTAEGNNLKILAEGATSSDALRKVDRYSLSFDYKDEIPVKVFYVEAFDGQRIDYLPKSAYKGHFVIFNSGTMGGNWIDFEGEKGIPIVERISDSKYKISFPSDEKSLLFESIGGLNMKSVSYAFYRGNYSLIFPTTFTGEVFSASINLSDDSLISNISASLVYNGSFQTVVYDSDFYLSSLITAPSIPGVYAYVWNLTVLLSDNSTNFSFLVNGTHSVLNWSFGNCSNFTNKIVSFRVFDESNPPGALNASIFEIQMTYWISNVSNSKNFSALYPLNDTFHICVLNSSINYTVDAYVKYEGEFSGLTHRFYLVLEDLVGTGQNYSIYQLNSSIGTSNLRITVRNKQSYQYFSNVIGKLQRFYTSENLWRTVQMDESDEYGLLFFNVIEESTDYRIIFSDRNNSVLKTTENMKFSCDAGVCDLTYLLTPADQITTSPALVVNHTFDNNTGILSIAWNDPLGYTSSVRLNVMRETLTGSALMCNQTQIGAAGNMSCNVSGYTGSFFVKIYSSASPETGFEGFWISMGKQAIKDFISSTESVLYTSLIVIVIILMGIFSPVGVIIMSVVSLIIVSALGIISIITITFIIIAAAIGIALAIKMRS